ncbi:MAG: hypothetical protein L0Y72_03085 [Gemmataceae bacterium]|nr:hypothetical protein [Gemmataceae bacterium]MCI0738002.1 hypothetical protein [Gemmataceae bacterium]
MHQGKVYFTDDLVQTSGQTRFLGGSLEVWGSFTISMGSSVTGEGTGQITIAAWEVINSGTIVVSTSGNGIFSVSKVAGVGGDFTQTSTGHLYTKIAGVAAYDQVLIEGIATLDGTLNLSLFGGFLPNAVFSWTLLSANQRIGSFAFTNLPPGFSIDYPGKTVRATYNPLPGGGGEED